MGTLVINEYGKDTREFRITDVAMRIGRDPRADIVLGDLAVSRYHACILRQGNSFLIQDLGSSNGTYLNEKKIPERGTQPLSHGDRVKIGRSILRFIMQVTSKLLVTPRTTATTETSPRTEEPEEPTEKEAPLCLFRLDNIEAVLLVAHEGAPPQRHQLTSDRVRIGSDPRSDVVLTDPSVSAHHAEIVYNREGFHLVERDSARGTFLNGVSVRVARLSHRSFVKFGKQKAFFVIHEGGMDGPDVSFRLRDHLAEVYPEKRELIQQAFKACREGGLDIAEELVARGILDPEEWWLATERFTDKSSVRLDGLNRFLPRFFSRKQKRSPREDSGSS